MATEKITLYDSERDMYFGGNLMFLQQMLNVRPQFIFNSHLYIFPYLSLIHIFVTELLKRVISQEPQSSTSTNVDYENYDCDNDGTNEDFINEEDTGDLNSETHEREVILFFMFSMRLYRWSPPCVLLLLETYRSMEGTLNSGKLSQKKVWEEITKELTEKGYNIMEEIFAKKAWCNPVAVASSTGLSSKQSERNDSVG
ncbi:hypothetical protein NQ318_020654 [Aromia moschata]|uniref:Myb/SANT-like DNA-binding domain-containing protein n=1 Tax=Aromia moschata TaxID=1265417 RepID=A0AAV8X1B5_9CUCU|nr:hypothetical protein NQ318_020654 [Aromia moschata]